MFLNSLLLQWIENLTLTDDKENLCLAIKDLNLHSIVISNTDSSINKIKMTHNSNKFRNLDWKFDTISNNNKEYICRIHNQDFLHPQILLPNIVLSYFKHVKLITCIKEKETSFQHQTDQERP